GRTRQRVWRATGVKWAHWGGIFAEAADWVPAANARYVLCCMYERCGEWDEAKNEANKEKHGIDFETAQFAFDDAFSVSFVERITDGGQRWHLIGSIEEVLLVVVVHTYRESDGDEVIRIISARQATRRERRLYVQGNG